MKRGYDNLEAYQKDFNDFKEQLSNLLSSKKDASKKEDDFVNFYTEIGTMAVEGDASAQDFMSYMLKKGNAYLPENYVQSMKWAILAGSNGNWYALEKLLLFLNPAIDALVYNPDLTLILQHNGLDETTYEYGFGMFMCQGIADELKLNPLELSKEKITEEKFQAKVHRQFEIARDNALPKVKEFLIY